MNILVTGGAGFIGSNLVISLLNIKKIKKIYVYDNYSSGSKRNHIKSNKIIYIKGDTVNILKNRFITSQKFKYIFHFAEFSRIVPSFEHFDRCWSTNVLGTKKVIELAIINASKLVYSASSSKFGNKTNEFLSPYAWTKAKNVELIKSYNEWFGLNYIITYFYNVYGPNQIKKHFMSAVIGIFEQQYIEKKPLTVVKPGNQKRDFTHVNDIVSGCLKAAFNHNNKEYQIASGKLYTVLQIAKMFNTRIKMIPERPGERFTSKRDNLKKTFKELKFKPAHNIREYVKNFKNNN